MNEGGPADLIYYRLEQARDALEDAKFLYEHHRSTLGIVNRAYYAMFYTASALLWKIGQSSSKHAGVISLFDSEFIRTKTLPQELSRDLHRGFELRQKSDYQPHHAISREKAKEVVERASAFVETAIKYLLESDNP